MQRFKNVLLVADRSYQSIAAQRVAWLARRNEARVTLIDTIETAPGELAALYASFHGARAREVEFEVLQFHQSRLAELSAEIRNQGIETNEALLHGTPFIEIIHQVIRSEHDLVIKVAGGQSEGLSLLFGSTDLHLLRKCPCPVWILKPVAQPEYPRIVAAIDPDPSDPQRDALASLVMDLATSLAVADESELHVVHAWHLEGEETMRNSAFTKIPKPQIDELVDKAAADARERYSQLLGRYNLSLRSPRIHLLKGEARSVISEMAEEITADLIVMGTVGRTGISGFFIGNTAEATLNQVDCSVIAVKPPGFESPVKLSDSQS